MQFAGDASSQGASGRAGEHRVAAWGRPEMPVVRVGFIALTDCASVVMAAELGFDEQHGVKIVPTRESSWAGLRDKLVHGNSIWRMRCTGSPTACTSASVVRRRTWRCG